MVMGVLTAVGVAIPCHLYTNWYHIPIFLGMCVGFFILWAAIYLLAEKVPTDRKCLVVANHLSNYDPISIMTHMPLKPLIFISKPENFNLPVAGGIVRKAGFMAIDRDHVKNAIITINKAADKIKNDRLRYLFSPKEPETAPRKNCWSSKTVHLRLPPRHSVLWLFSQ